MAPNKKKKKAAVNPARGFATTSLPSKSKVTQEVDTQDDDETTEAGALTSSSNHDASGAATAIGQAASTNGLIEAMTPEELEAHLEDADLQNLVELHATKCKADASRQVSRLQIERRQLRAQSLHPATANWLSEETVDDIFRANAEDECTQASRSSSELVVRGPVLEDQTLIVRLWTLRRVLIALKFSNINDVIEHILRVASSSKIESTLEYVWGLREALDWYANHAHRADLPDYENGNVASLTQAEQYLQEDSETEDGQDSSQLGTPIAVGNSTPTDDEHESEGEYTPIPSTDSEADDDPATLTTQYVLTRTMQFNMEQKSRARAGKMSRRHKDREARLQGKIDKLKRDMLFDQDSAEQLWQDTLQDLQFEAARSAKWDGKPRSAGMQKRTNAGNYDADNEDEILLGNMFDSDQNKTSVPCATQPSNIRYIDFGRWTGVQPRKILEEVCKSVDQKIKLKFHTISTTSFATRQKVDLVLPRQQDWDLAAIHSLPEGLETAARPRRLTITMQAIATGTPAQAEAYLSTLCVFVLAYSGLGEQKQYMRLPSVWTELYHSTIDRHKQTVLLEDKTAIKELKAIMSRVHEAPTAQDTGNDRKQNDVRSILPMRSGRPALPQTRLEENDARSLWTIKSESPAYQRILQDRQKLPVHHYKDEILQAIDGHGLVVLCADTGAGKSTQVPSFILEYSLSHGRDIRVLVTQPRRISAISLARRVSQELGEGKNDVGTDRSLVGYAIRLESKTSSSTRITFATTGVLLRMIESTPDLDDLDFLILDEVHERTMDLDLLFIALRKLQKRRSSLKIVLMSATVNAQKFSTYFESAPILDIPGRTFPVEVRYLEDAIEETLGYNTSGSKSTQPALDDEDSARSDDQKDDRMTLAGLDAYKPKVRNILSQMDQYRIDYELVAHLALAIATKPRYIRYSTAMLIFAPGMAEIRRIQSALLHHKEFTSGWIIHLLHSSFSTEDLEGAFAIPPSGVRKIVIATNIAETGITIPDVTAVIDTCKEKIMRFDERRQLSRLTEGFISRSSARQRKGRAARVQEGLCFHLVTKNRYESLMSEQNTPEMLRLSLQDPILRIKIWNLGSITDTLSDAIDPPTLKNIRRAVEKLKDAGALSATEELTPLGKQLARLPLEVVLAKLAVFGIVFRCLDTVITMIASLSSKSPFVSDKSGGQSDARLAFSRGESDLISTVNAYQGWKKARLNGQVHQFCRKHHLNDAALSSIEDQKIQLLVYLADAGLLRLEASEKLGLTRARGYGQRKTFFEIPGRYNVFDNDNMANVVLAMAFYPRVLAREGKGWRNVYTNQQVQLTSGSVHRLAAKPPKWLCYYEAMQSKSGAMNVLETSSIPEAGIVLLLGEAEIKYFSGVIVVDNGKVRFAMRQWRQVAAVKAMRGHLTAALQRCWQASGLAVSAQDDRWLNIFANIVCGSDEKLNSRPA